METHGHSVASLSLSFSFSKITHFWDVMIQNDANSHHGCSSRGNGSILVL